MARSVTATWTASGDSMAALLAAFAGIGGVEGGGETGFFAVIAGAVPESRPANPGRAVPPDDAAVRILAHDVVDEQVLGDDVGAFRSAKIGDSGDVAGV